MQVPLDCVVVHTDGALMKVHNDCVAALEIGQHQSEDFPRHALQPIAHDRAADLAGGRDTDARRQSRVFALENKHMCHAPPERSGPRIGVQIIRAPQHPVFLSEKEPLGPAQWIRARKALTLPGLSCRLRVAGGQPMAPFGAPTLENQPSVLRSHALAEAVLIAPLANTRLKGALHFPS